MRISSSGRVNGSPMLESRAGRERVDRRKAIPEKNPDLLQGNDR